MRCNNCGWTNPAGAATCQKCNQPLEFSPIRTSSTAFDPRATMVETCPPVADPRATMAEAYPTAADPRATMVDTRQTVADPRATMVDARQTAPNPRATMFDVTPDTKVYNLYCMDDASKARIQMMATSDLELQPGDIIFVKNLRYQVK